jgi:hypothetical protein
MHPSTDGPVPLTLTTDVTEHTCVTEFTDAFIWASPGETLVYARGLLDSSVERGLKDNAPHAKELKALREHVHALHESGRAALTQRRVAGRPWEQREVGAFEYRCTKVGGQST